MKNYIQQGEALDLVAPRNLGSDEGFMFGALFAVADGDASSGSPVVGVTNGVFELPKASAAVFAAGGKVSWDDTAYECKAPGSGLFPIGVAVQAAGAGSTAALVRLNGVATSAAA